MKYDEKTFQECVSYYKEKINVKNKVVLITFPKDNKKAFFSIAPLSRALHELSCEVTAVGYGEDKNSIEVLEDIWEEYENLEDGKAPELSKFIEKVKNKISDFENIFRKPDLVLNASSAGFNNLEFKDSWLVEYKTAKLKETGKILWDEVYNIKNEERVGIGFELINIDKMLGHPLKHYLDSYQIIWGMSESCNGKVILTASTKKGSMMLPSDRISELRTVLLGCELEKDIDEEPFSTFNNLSKKLNLERLKPADATFFISGKGYPGKHAFGEKIGYPSKNKKTRWNSPGQFIYKFDFFPQTRLDDRKPQSRVAFTETLPIDIFIDTNLVDWADIRERNQKVKGVMDKCDKIFVKSNIKEKHTTNLEVNLVQKNGKRRWVKRSDTDVREKINKEYFDMTGIVAGCMGNIPGGEAFVTPESVKGTFVGDVVIAIDQSYPLSPEDPFVVECTGNDYKVIAAPKETLQKFNKKKEESWKLLMESKKHESLPKEIIEMKEKNFDNIGEFAINTHPKAKLCDYLIVNEKIARMMHIALGSGYEEDRSTEYHMDIVFDAPRQKLDVYGIDQKGNEHWILKKGNFVA